MPKAKEFGHFRHLPVWDQMFYITCQVHMGINYSENFCDQGECLLFSNIAHTLRSYSVTKLYFPHIFLYYCFQFNDSLKKDSLIFYRNTSVHTYMSMDTHGHTQTSSITHHRGLNYRLILQSAVANKSTKFPTKNCF